MDGTLIADGHLGYSGGFGRDRIMFSLHNDWIPETRLCSSSEAPA